jgi:hypothetical protein
MDRDKLSKTIAGILKMLVKATQQDRIDFDEDLAHEQIISLLAPVIEAAELWEKVEEIAKRNWMDDPCEDCPVEERCDSCNSLCGQADSVVDALKEKWGWEECKRDCENICPCYDEEKYGACSGKIRAEWAREECPECKDGYAMRRLGDRVETTIDQCQHCSGSGKIRSERAREKG